MSERMRFTRRALLAGTGLSVLAGAAYSVPLYSGYVSSCMPAGSGGNPGTASLRRIGLAYLRSGHERNAADAMSKTARLEHGELQNRIAADFEAGRIVICDGWVLSETEARHCGTIALS